MRSVTLLALAACAADTSPEAQCDRATACAEEGGFTVDDATYQACIDFQQQVADAMAEAGCTDDYEAVVRCGYRHASCEGGQLILSEGCDDQTEALDTCTDDAGT